MIHMNASQFFLLWLSELELLCCVSIGSAVYCAADGFVRAEAHAQPVQNHKRRLIKYTTMQSPDATKRFGLHVDDSCNATGAILEQEQRYVGFLTQDVHNMYT